MQLGGPVPRWEPVGRLAWERPGAVARWQPVLFYLGILIAGLALLSPLHVLGERYLLSAHMIQHLLLTMVVPPLWLLGTPGWMLRPLLRIGVVRRGATALCSAPPALLLFNLVFAAWHVPPIYELSLHFEPAHILEHGLFTGLALLTWWPVLSQLPELPRLPYGAQVMYLFLESVPPTILGAIIALAEVPIYQTYWNAPRVFITDPLADQQAGGLLMWIPGALIYFSVLTVVWFIWMERRAPGSAAPYGTVNPDRAKLQATKGSAR